MKFDRKYIELKHNELLEKDPIRISNLVVPLSNGKYRLKSNVLPATGAVYIFWWLGDCSEFFKHNINQTILFKGPNQREVGIEFTQDWLASISIDGKIPLYVGKTADNVHKRISLHLQLGTQRGLSLGNGCLYEKRMTSSNQLRDRIERIFINCEDTREIVLKNVGVSFMHLDSDEESVTRFYLEDKVIGELYPLFNIDIER